MSQLLVLQSQSTKKMKPSSQKKKKKRRPKTTSGESTTIHVNALISKPIRSPMCILIKREKNLSRKHQRVPYTHSLHGKAVCGVLMRAMNLIILQRICLIYLSFFFWGITFKIVFRFKVRNRASPGSLQSLFQSKYEVFVMVSSSTFNVNETDRHNKLRN